MVQGSLTSTGSLTVGDGSPAAAAVIDETGDITGSVWNGGKLSDYLTANIVDKLDSVVQNVQLGAESALISGTDSAPSGCLVSFVDTGEVSDGFKYKPIQIQINGTFVTISG